MQLPEVGRASRTSIVAIRKLLKSPLPRIALCLLVAILASLNASAQRYDAIAAGFKSPPASARPWVYWFWLNGNITRAGITADLEAMKRAGIGGALIMEVDQGAPLGPVPFAGAEWRSLFKFVLSEAGRLGLEINMNGDAGWCGSGGPWITPEHAMQKLVWTETVVTGPTHLHTTLRQPDAVAGFYRDVAVMGFPTVGGGGISDLPGKSGLVRQDIPERTIFPVSQPGQIIAPNKELDLSVHMNASGEIDWDVPEGSWTLMRLGYTPTGAVNAPAPASGRGLECDKLSKEGSAEAFRGLLANLLSDSPGAAGKSLVSMHIDSWEMGSQNWTARFPEEFLRLRGYDIRRYLPVFSGRIVGSAQESERFLWDVRQTIGDLLARNYAANMRSLANKAGIRLSIEAYGDAVFDDITYGGMCDEPMTEFWSWPGNFTAGIAHEMASAAHIYGKKILGAEAFTAGDGEKWLFHPGSIKPLGDWALCRGVNRFVFHRFAMQPWGDRVAGRSPGMSMGPWGLHYERTQTWWPLVNAWHEYLSRCQYLLRQGLPKADILYLEPEGAPRSFSPPAEPDRHGYRSDTCTPDALYNRISVKNGRLALPDGNSYRMLVLPSGKTMTPRLLRRIAELANAGALIIGKRPVQSPGLAGYPNCDTEIRQIAASLWGSGKVIDTLEIESTLRQHGTSPDFISDRVLDFTHRSSAAAGTDKGMEIYFVANGSKHAVNARCTFRVAGRIPELWNPQTGEIQSVPQYTESSNGETLNLRLEAAGSTFVIFAAKQEKRPSQVVSVERNGKPVGSNGAAAEVHILKAIWGPIGDASRTRDVTSEVARHARTGDGSFVVAELAAGGDPAVNVIKTLIVDYEVNGKRMRVTATDPETIGFELPADAPAALKLESTGRGLVALPNAPGRYTLHFADGKSTTITAKSGEEVVAPFKSWHVAFPSKSGAPASIELNQLQSLSMHPTPGVRYFSGIASYTTQFLTHHRLQTGRRRITLDLGDVQVMARVTLNGKLLGVLWHAPYQVDISRHIKPGLNALRVEVANLWPNRMIGDEHLPEDSARQGNGTLSSWPQWLTDGKPSPTGRFTFTSWRLWSKDSPLPPSGLIGPVKILSQPEIKVK